MQERKKRGSRGFTIVELMTTVVVIGIAAAMAAPRMQMAYERTQFRGVVKNINSTLRLARSYAISNKVPYGVYFNPDAMTITLFKDLVNPASFDFTTGDSAIRVDSLPSEFVWLGTDVTNNVVTFSPNGSAGFSGGGNISSLGNTCNLVAVHTTNVLASTGRIESSFSIY